MRSSQGAYQPVTNFVSTLDTLKGKRGRWASAVVAGDKQPFCESQFGSADYAERLQEFVATANNGGGGNVFTSICAGNMAVSLEQVLGSFQAACQDFTPIE